MVFSILLILYSFSCIFSILPQLIIVSNIEDTRDGQSQRSCKIHFKFENKKKMEINDAYIVPCV